MIYRMKFSGGRVKYGFTESIESREKTYKTHVGDLLESTLEFPLQKDMVDELAIREYLTKILGLAPLGGSKEIFNIPSGGKLDIIDSDVSLEKFYRHLNQIFYVPGGSGKLSSLLLKRMSGLSRLFEHLETDLLDVGGVNAMADLMDSLYLRNKFDISSNIFLKSRVDPKCMQEILDLGLTYRDALDIWFKWEWERL